MKIAIKLFAGTLILSSAAFAAQEPFSFSSASVEVDEQGRLIGAQAVEIPIAGGTLIAKSVDFPAWDDAAEFPANVVRIKGKSVLLLEDGTEMRFGSAELDVPSGRFTINGSVSLDFAKSELGGKARAPVEFTCTLGRLFANGLNTGFTSVCLTGRTRLWCSGNTLRVQTQSTFCDEP